MATYPARREVGARSALGRAANLIAPAAALGAAGGLAVHLLISPTHMRMPALPLPELHGQASWAAGARPAPTFTLSDVLGGSTSLTSLRGRVTLIAFLDSRCSSSCPFIGQAVSDAEAMLPPGARPAVVVVSIDPAADTPASVHEALQRWHTPADWRWLSGTRRQLSRIWHAYGVDSGSGAGTVAPRSALYLLDASGNERAGYLPPVLPNVLALDIRTVDADGAKPAGRYRS